MPNILKENQVIMSAITIEEICKIRSDIGRLVDAHPEELKESFETALQECADLGDADEIKKQYDEMIVPGRQLHIGIVGRVKAGKSSMLNSLFFGGKNVLPKAATPMTAALTKLYYSEKPTLRIHFFDENDKLKIQEKADRYKKLLESEVENRLNNKRERAKSKGEPFDEVEQRKKCEKSVRSSLAEDNVILAGAAEQNDMIKNASADVLQMLGKSVEKELNRIEDVARELSEYVGADGAYTPITRDVELGFPFDDLKSIIVVDTPGFDDPVPSRDAAARNSLKNCDAIFVLSPAGQFCNEEDRINIEKIEKGEGIQNIYVVASKIDAELGNESKDEADGDIQKELQLIVKNISQTLKKLIEGFPKDGLLYTKLSEDLNRGLLYTAGICQSMYETWENKSSWDSDATDTWNRLREIYPAYFESEDESARETLKIIGNIGDIRSRIEEVRNKKDEILHGREDKFLNAKADMVKKVAVVLKENFIEKMRAFETADINTLKNEQEKQSENFEVLKEEFEENLSDVFEDYITDCREVCNNIISDFFAGTKESVSDAKGTTNEMRSKDVRVNDGYDLVKKTGAWNAIKRFFGSESGYERQARYRTETQYYDVTVHTLNAIEVREAISDFAQNMADVLQVEVDKKRRILRGNIKSCILNVWAKYQMAEYVGEKSRGNQAGNIVSAIPDCNISIDWELPARLYYGCRLTDSDADEFMDAAKAEMHNIKVEYTDSVKKFISSVKTKLDAAKTSDMILSKMKKNIDEMMCALNQREATLDNYKRIQSEINEFAKQFA